jgi:hypothetical protein
VPEFANSARVDEHAAHTFPEASTATANGPGYASPPPLFDDVRGLGVPPFENLLTPAMG